MILTLSRPRHWLVMATLLLMGRPGGAMPRFQAHVHAPAAGSSQPPKPTGVPAGPVQKPEVSIQILDAIQCGAVIPGPAQGSLVLSPVPGGLRAALSGARLAEDATVVQGAFTLSGPPGTPWTLSLVGGADIRLAGPQGADAELVVTKVAMWPERAWTGVFPPGPGPVSTTPRILVGLTVQIPAGLNKGRYTGQLPLLVQAGRGINASAFMAVTLVVDPMPLALAKVADLEFGGVLVGAESGVLVLDPKGARATKGGVRLGDGAAAGPFHFRASGSPNSAISILLPDKVILTGPAGQTMTLIDFTTEPSAGRLGRDGNQDVTVGASVKVAGHQVPGRYSGTFTVSVTYQ